MVLACGPLKALPNNQGPQDSPRYSSVSDSPGDLQGCLPLTERHPTLTSVISLSVFKELFCDRDPHSPD